jgi:hypothetical protein
MKIDTFWLDNKDQCKIKFIAETQEEAAMLYRLGSYIKKPNGYYGRVDKEYTWAWLFLPLNKKEYPEYFGNSD